MVQKLMTKAIEKQFEKFGLYSQENVKAKDKHVVCKFFSPYADYTFYATEGSKEGDDFIMFGFVRMYGDIELGYVSLKELEKQKFSRFNVQAIERDMYFKACKAESIKELEEYWS